LELGATIDFSYGPEIVLNVIKPLVNSIAAHSIDFSQLMDRQHVFVLNVAASAAYAVARPLGLVATMSYVHDFDDPAVLSPGRRNDFLAGVALDFDLGAISEVPIGFTVAYRAGVPLSGGVSMTNTIDGSLVYTGRPNLVLGLDANASWFQYAVPLSPALAQLPLDQGIGARVLVLTSFIRYYW
jgi:hypothetical protein